MSLYRTGRIWRGKRCTTYLLVYGYYAKCLRENFLVQSNLRHRPSATSPERGYVSDHLHWNERKDGPWCFKDWDESILWGILDQQTEEVEDLKLFKTKAVTIFAVIQFAMAAIVFAQRFI